MGLGLCGSRSGFSQVYLGFDLDPCSALPTSSTTVNSAHSRLSAFFRTSPTSYAFPPTSHAYTPSFTFRFLSLTMTHPIFMLMPHLLHLVSPTMPTYHLLYRLFLMLGRLANVTSTSYAGTAFPKTTTLGFPLQISRPLQTNF